MLHNSDRLLPTTSTTPASIATRRTRLRQGKHQTFDQRFTLLITLFYHVNRPFRGSRGRGLKFRGTPRNGPSRRSNNLVLSNVRAEDETFKVSVIHGDKFEKIYLMNLLRENLADENTVFYNVSYTFRRRRMVLTYCFVCI